jgi:hypothetical protein
MAPMACSGESECTFRRVLSVFESESMYVCVCVCMERMRGNSTCVLMDICVCFKAPALFCLYSCPVRGHTEMSVTHAHALIIHIHMYMHRWCTLTSWALRGTARLFMS